MNPQPNPFRRVVTGHNAESQAIVVSDAPPLHTQLVGGPGGPTFYAYPQFDIPAPGDEA